MLKSMRPTEADERAEPGAEATEERREAEQDPVAEQRVPDPLGLSAWEDPPTGVLGRLLAKLSQDGAEAYVAVEELRRFVTAQIRREIRALMKTIDARFSVQAAKTERKSAALERETASIERQTASIERQTEEVKALTKAVQDLRVIVAVQNVKLDTLRWMLGIVILFLVALVAMGISNY